MPGLYPKEYEGYGHWQQFITKDYYEFHKEKEKSVYDICQCKDPDQTNKLDRQVAGINNLELIWNLHARQKLLAQNIIKEKNPDEENLVAMWLKENTRHFGKMSMELVHELA